MIPVYFATNRNQIGSEELAQFGDRFHADGPAWDPANARLKA